MLKVNNSEVGNAIEELGSNPQIIGSYSLKAAIKSYKLFNLLTNTGDILDNISFIEGVELDYLVKFLNTEEIAANLKHTVDKETLNYLKGYADGINYWAALNSSKIDKSLFPVNEDDLLTGMIFRMPLFYGLDHYIDQLIDLMSVPNEQPIVANALLSLIHI